VSLAEHAGGIGDNPLLRAASGFGLRVSAFHGLFFTCFAPGMA
jgi:hypothetical protein